MSNSTEIQTKFRIGDDNLRANQTIKNAFDEYSSKRYAFGTALRELNDSTKQLHDLLDGPLRSSGLIPEGKDWTLKEDSDDGLYIFVWSEPKHRGRKKPELPVREVKFKAA